MFKKLLLALSTLLIITSNAKVYFPDGVDALAIQKAPAEAKIVAWDIHDVLAQSQKWSKAGYALKSLPTFGLSLWNLLSSKITGNKDPMNEVWSEISQLPKKFGSSGEVYYHIFQKHNQPQLAKRVAKISNLYTPQPGMETIVQTLHANGIEQRLASNIGPVFFDRLRDTFKTKYNSAIFDYIQPGKIVDYNNLAQQQLVQASIVTPFKKPLTGFYTDFNIAYNNNNDKLVVFIDDNKANAKAAAKAGWIGIRFENVKQLKADLATLGFAVTA